MEQLPPGIRRHWKGYQVDVVIDGKRRRPTVATLKEAIQTRLLSEAESIAAPKGVKTLQDAYDQAMIEQWSRSKSEKSKRNTLYNAGIVITFFGANTPISNISRSDITAFDEYLRQQGDSDSTINRKHAPLSTMLTIALEHGWIEHKPVIKHFDEGEGRIRWLSEGEESLFMSQFERWGLRDHIDAMILLLDTGCRNGELWDLPIDDVNLSWVNPETGKQTGLIHLWRTKTGNPRSLPLTQRAYEVIARRRITAVDGKLFPYDNAWFRRYWDRVKLVNKLKDDDLVPYCCRHTCATRLLQRGMKLPELQAWLGHKNIQMTMRYAHLAPTALVIGASLLEKGVTHVQVNGIGSGTISDGRMRD